MAAKVLKHWREGPWDGTINKPVPLVIRMLPSDWAHKYFLPNGRPASVALLSWYSFSREFTSKPDCLRHCFQWKWAPQNRRYPIIKHVSKTKQSETEARFPYNPIHLLCIYVSAAFILTICGEKVSISFTKRALPLPSWTGNGFETRSTKSWFRFHCVCVKLFIHLTKGLLHCLHIGASRSLKQFSFTWPLIDAWSNLKGLFEETEKCIYLFKTPRFSRPQSHSAQFVTRMTATATFVSHDDTHSFVLRIEHSCIAVCKFFQKHTWGSQWGGGFYGYRPKFWLFYGYRFIFLQLRFTKKLKINFFCFKNLNINQPVFLYL